MQGVELGVAGALTDNWGVSSGFTTMNTTCASSGPSVLADGSTALAYTPKKAFTLWTTYQLPVRPDCRRRRPLQRQACSAAPTVRWERRRTSIRYWVFDAMASYRINKNIDIQLNLYNLFDKDYVAAINKSGYRYTPGTPRSAKITANFAF